MISCWVEGQTRYRRAYILFFAGISLMAAWQTLRYSRVWKNDVKLWTYATELNPTNWQNWNYLAEGEKIVGGPGWADRAEQAYIRSLHSGLFGLP